MKIVWAERSKSERKKLRMEMLAQAETILAGLYSSKAQLRAAARVLVDRSLAREMNLAR